MTAPLWGERRVLSGRVDFTMMYAAHDAFARDLTRLTAASDGRPWDPRTTLAWATFTEQLNIHHRAEDEALWPPLRAAVVRAEDVALLDAMAAEHGYLDPALAAVDAAREAQDWPRVAETIPGVDAGLRGHMRHEENEALPLVEDQLGAEGWNRFAAHIRKTQGLRDAATYFPWLLDDAPVETRAAVLALVPPPVRVLYRRVWAPRYQRRR